VWVLFLDYNLGHDRNVFIMYRLASIANNHKLALYVTLGFSAIVFYDVAWDLLMSLIHTVFVALHYVFETCEQLLELSIEHFLHTSPRTAEIMVFYIFASLLAGITFTVLRKMPGWYCVTCQRLNAYHHAQKTNALQWWQKKTFLMKTKWCAMLAASFTVLTLLSFC
jgi:hypothetical protein